jgi:hypothetical protein
MDRDRFMSVVEENARYKPDMAEYFAGLFSVLEERGLASELTDRIAASYVDVRADAIRDCQDATMENVMHLIRIREEEFAGSGIAAGDNCGCG